MNNIKFLSLAEILLIHKYVLELYGGIDGIRDLSLLSSAVAMPESSFEGKYLHENIFQMSSAYAFHICQNHPFLDGNKRTALASALVFLDLNGYDINDKNNVLYHAIMEIASSKKDKKYLTDILKELSIKK
jgi:death on curing protein